MIDLNTLVSNALVAAVQQATAPLNERIAKLELCNAERHQRLLVLEGALTDRVVALESAISHKVQVQQANITAALAERIAALELQRGEMQRTIVTYSERIAALENNPAQGMEPAITIDEARMVEALNSQEWFWEKLQNKIDASVEQSMDHHLECYDHDNYDEIASKVDDLPDNLDDYVTRDSVREEIEDVLNNATLSLSI